MVSRGAGRSAVAAAAYLSCSRLLNEYDGVQHDYTANRTLCGSRFFCRLPLPQSGRIEKYGMCADVAIHDPYPPGHNPHAHILLTVRPLDEKGKWQYKTEKEYLCVKDGEERGFTAAEFKQAQADGWEKQYQYKVGKKKVYMIPSVAQRRAMNGYPNILKAPNMAGKIPSRNTGTATSSLFCGGLHGRMWQTAIWSAPGTKNASTTAAMPSVLCWSGPRSMRVWLPEPWRKRALSLTGAN